MQQPTNGLETHGFEVIEGVLDETECRLIGARFPSDGLAATGERNILDQPWCQALSNRLRRHFGIARRLPRGAVAVQCTIFAKSIEHNWLVAAHQDLSIPVSERIESSQSTGWSEKDGVLFVQPRVTVLQELVAVRVHLDDCAAENGALRVVPGSHRFGRLSAASVQSLRSSIGETVCPVRRGGVLLMRPLLLHASSKAQSRAPRRVLHFVFGPPRLPDGLTWHLGVRSDVT